MTQDKTFYVNTCQNWIKRYFHQSRRLNESTLIQIRTLKRVKQIKFSKIKVEIFLDALFKTDTRSDGKQEFFLGGLIQDY